MYMFEACIVIYSKTTQLKMTKIVFALFSVFYNNIVQREISKYTSNVFLFISVNLFF